MGLLPCDIVVEPGFKLLPVGILSFFLILGRLRRRGIFWLESGDFRLFTAEWQAALRPEGYRQNQNADHQIRPDPDEHLRYREQIGIAHLIKDGVDDIEHDNAAVGDAESFKEVVALIEGIGTYLADCHMMPFHQAHQHGDLDADDAQDGCRDQPGSQQALLVSPLPEGEFGRVGLQMIAEQGDTPRKEDRAGLNQVAPAQAKVFEGDGPCVEVEHAGYPQTEDIPDEGDGGVAQIATAAIDRAIDKTHGDQKEKAAQKTGMQWSLVLLHQEKGESGKQ